MKTKILSIAMLLLCTAYTGISQEHTHEHEYDISVSGNDYPITPVPFTSVSVCDSFWAPRIKMNHEVTIPHAINMCDSRIMNFKIAAGLETGSFQTAYPFDDSEVYKVIQGASYALQYYEDPELDELLDSLISIIALAQEDDGYIYTIRTIDGDYAHNWIGTRWSLVHDLSHELYNIGHLLEAASAHYTATGKTNFLDIAIKAANCVDNAFGWGKIENYPGHQEIEKGLVELYRVTNEPRYLDLAKFFLDVRGNGPEYCQAHLPVTQQEEAVGHSVRAVYMYAGMADVAAIMNEPDYITAIDKIWNDIVSKKMYVTGGIGASGGNEGFSEAYSLPNSSAYCETCASIGNVYFNERLFLLHGEGKYIDVLERTLYNAMLSGISYSGDRFFYPNPLESSGSERSAWFSCSCCPSNVTRIIPSVPGYIYAQKSDSVYVNLFMSNQANLKIGDDSLKITQKTNYPWEGQNGMSVNLKENLSFKLMIRLPGWARNEAIPGDLYTFMDNSEETYSLSINGTSYEAEQKGGYLVLDREWADGDTIVYDLPFPVRKVFSSPEITTNSQKLALQQGPMVYCSEWVDNPNSNLLYQTYDSNMLVTSEFDRDLFFGTNVLKTTLSEDEGDADFSFIPYHLWCNRGYGPMQVWLSVKPERELPDSLILIQESLGDEATTNHVSSWEDIRGIYDLYDPVNSQDKGPAAFGNWTSNGSTLDTWNWVQYTLHQKYNITASDVYWWDDNAGIDLVDECFLSYYDYETNDYVEIPGTRKLKSDGGILPDTYNSFVFDPVNTDIIRLNFKGVMAQGILEWMIYQTFSSNNISPEQHEIEPSIKVYPNPASNKIFLESTSTEPSHLVIYNSNGAKVLDEVFFQKSIVNIPASFSDGIYLVKIKNKEDSVSKIILIKH